jgi:hypothetical protein
MIEAAILTIFNGEAESEVFINRRCIAVENQRQHAARRGESSGAAEPATV